MNSDTENRANYLIGEMRASIENRQGEGFLQLFTEFQTLQPHPTARPTFKIPNLNISGQTSLEFGKAKIKIFFNNLCGTGNLKIVQSEFSEGVSFRYLANYSGKRIEFVDCSSEKAVSIIESPTEQLSFHFTGKCNSTSLLNIEVAKTSAKRFYISKCHFLGLGQDSNSRVKNIHIHAATIDRAVSLQALGSLEPQKLQIRNSTLSGTNNLNVPTPLTNASWKIQNSTFENPLLIAPHISHNFTKSVAFLNCTFLNDLIIQKCHFKKKFTLRTNRGTQVIAEDSTFGGISLISSANLSSLKVKGSTFWRRADFNIRDTQTVEISKCTLASDTHIEDCEFQKSSFRESQFGSYTSFKRSSFKVAPNFAQAKFLHATTFRGCKFFDITSKNSEGRYRNLKDLMRQIANDSDEMIFSSYELESRQKDLWKEDPFEYAIGITYYLINSYGRSIFLPLRAMLVIWLIYAWIFWYFESFYIETTAHRAQIAHAEIKLPEQSSSQSPPEVSWTVHAANENRIVRASIFSGINMLGPLRLVSFFEAFKLTKFRYVLLTWSQSIVATVLWYLFIVGIKRRFRTG